MALTPEETSLINSLALRHDSEIPELEEYDRLYEGTQGLTYMHPEIYREVAARIDPAIVNYPKVAVDAIEERLRLEGFKTGDEEIDTELWRVWQANRMQLGFRMAVVDALVMRRAYVCVGTNEKDAATPLVTPESPLELFADVDPRTHVVRSALRRVNEVMPGNVLLTRYATLYLPNATIWCNWDGGWREERRDVHNLGVVPVVPVLNAPRLRGTIRPARGGAVERMGRSDIEPIKSLSNNASKMATDMMIAAEFVAVPLRLLFGADPSMFADEQGNPTSPLRAMMGRLLAIPELDTKAFEFAAGQLSNFTNASRELAQVFAAVTGLPPHYVGMSADNPASADAIAASEARLNTRAERKQDSFECGAIEVARLIRRFQTGKWDPTLMSMTVDWRSPRTPTVGAMADAAVKLYMTTPPIVPLRQTREALGFTETEIDAMEEEDTKAAEQQPGAKLAVALSDQRAGDAAYASGG